MTAPARIAWIGAGDFSAAHRVAPVHVACVARGGDADRTIRNGVKSRHESDADAIADAYEARTAAGAATDAHAVIARVAAYISTNAPVAGTSSTNERDAMPKHEFLWIDLETTGLDPHNGAVLEFAAVLCEDARGDDLAIVAQYTGTLHADANARAGADAFVQKMHDANGLWRECEASTTTAQEVDAFLASVAAEQTGGRKRAVTLAGSSVHFDLAWCRVHFPLFAEYVSHRVFDVSTLRRAVESWAPPGAGAAGWQWPVRDVHRALPDVLATIAEARICRRAMRFDDGGAR